VIRVDRRRAEERAPEPPPGLLGWLRAKMRA
jgi:hypothetical protein